MQTNKNYRIEMINSVQLGAAVEYTDYFSVDE